MNSKLKFSNQNQAIQSRLDAIFNGLYELAVLRDGIITICIPDAIEDSGLWDRERFARALSQLAENAD